MFSFRCYACGATMGRGLPPIDALSTAQIAHVLPNEEDQAIQKMKARTLKDTRFEGMSAGSFCSFCLIWALEFPSALKGVNYTWENVLKTGGFDLDPRMTDMGAYTNRLMSFREAELMYQGPEAKPMLDMLRSLLRDGIEYSMIDCWFPECTKLEKILLPEDQRGCEDHAYFLRSFQFLSTERARHEFVTVGHVKGCECDSCFWIKCDDDDINREHDEQMAWEHRDGAHEEEAYEGCGRCPNPKEEKGDN